MSAPWAVGNADTVTKMNNPSGRIAGAASSLRAGFGGVIYNGVGISNSGASETDLISQSIAANVLSVDGYHLRLEAYILFANNANNKRVRVYFGATNALDTGNAAWQSVWGRLVVDLFRTGAATEAVFGNFYVGGTVQPITTGENNATETLSGAVTLRVTGQATSNGDLVANQWRVLWFPLADT